MEDEIEFVSEKITGEELKQLLINRNKDWIHKKDGSIQINGSLKTIVIGCIDSRVIIEKIFQAKPGELLVLKNAGNIISEDILRSILVGIYELNAKFIVILGHTRCGMAILDNQEKITHLNTKIGQYTLVKLQQMTKKENLEWFGFFNHGEWENNVHQQEKILQKMLDELVPKEKQPTILKAIYDIDSGKVIFLD